LTDTEPSDDLDAAGTCPHGIEAGHLPDPWIGGRLKCPQCRRDDWAPTIPDPEAQHEPAEEAGEDDPYEAELW
jgi:hypothetical protein